jgi:serine/threonine protein kinase/Tfp pilus assembly protein PilF
MIGSFVFQYEILAQLGEGGMGVVYKARDTKLDRVVALKFLPANVSRDEAAIERFTLEAKSASALNHENICAIHDIRETPDGQRFIVMALYEGSTLKDLLFDGPIDRDRALSITKQVGRGLAAAHELGIVHRDIKPANIVVTKRGRAVILDFGLTKLVGGRDLTQVGQTVGTVHYMSPEQARGEEIDSRTDVWALGVVLYEMLTGRRPFAGDYEQAVIYNIQNQDPEPLGERYDGALDGVVARALEKDRSRRYESVNELLADIEAIGDGRPVAVARRAPRKNIALVVSIAVVAFIAVAIGAIWFVKSAQNDGIDSLAVLPLINSSGNPDQEFLADGVTSAVINELSKIGALKVIARQSVMRFKDSQLSLREIADDLGVDAIVSGNVIRSGDSIRVSAELVLARSEENIWADSFNEPFENVLVLHSRLARDIAREINVSQTPTEELLLQETRTVNPEAYEAYLRGYHHLYLLSQADAEAARDYFEISLGIDSTYAEAYAGVALAWINLNQMNAVEPSEAIPAIQAALDRAAVEDSTLALVYYTRAVMQAWGTWEFQKALVNFNRAIELNPNYGEAHAYVAHLLHIIRRGNEGTPHAVRSIDLDPHNALFRSLYGDVLMFEGDFAAAAEQFRLSQQTAPRSFVNFNGLNWSYAALGQFEHANLARIRKYESVDDTEMVTALVDGFGEGGDGVAGYREASLRAAAVLVARAESTYVGPIQIQRLFTDGDDAESSIDWLERGIEVGEPGMPYVGVLPDADVLRRSSRYPDILRRMGLDMWID